MKIYDPVQEEDLRVAMGKEGVQILSIESKGVSLEDYFRMIIGDGSECGR